MQVIFDGHGRICSLIDKRAGNRQVIKKGELSNVFKFYEDIPLYWDAWDVEIYHLEKGWNCSLGTVEIKEKSPFRVVLHLKSKISETSSLSQDIIISALSAQIEFKTTVDWHENRRILKVEFPVLIKSDYATYESQFGYVSFNIKFLN